MYFRDSILYLIFEIKYVIKHIGIIRHADWPDNFTFISESSFFYLTFKIKYKIKYIRIMKHIGLISLHLFRESASFTLYLKLNILFIAF